MRALAVVAILATTASADAPKKAKHVPGAVTFVLDRSGSMQGAKLDGTKAAVMAAVNTLDPADEVAIVVFDSEANTIVRLRLAANKTALADKIATIQAGGGTDFLPALKAAEDTLEASKLATKHVILLSDGEAPYDGIEDLVHDMRANKITVSTVAIAGGDEVLLGKIAKEGGGRMYAVPDLKKLTQTFVDETRIALR